jgi:hypothetical protein
VPRENGGIVHSLRIQLRPHVHTPACDRRERICTAMGHVRELETLEVRSAQKCAAVRMRKRPKPADDGIPLLCCLLADNRSWASTPG